MILTLILLAVAGGFGWALFFVQKRCSNQLEAAARDAIHCARELERLEGKARRDNPKLWGCGVVLWGCLIWMLLRNRHEE